MNLLFYFFTVFFCLFATMAYLAIEIINKKAGIQPKLAECALAEDENSSYTAEHWDEYETVLAFCAAVILQDPILQGEKSFSALTTNGDRQNFSVWEEQKMQDGTMQVVAVKGDDDTVIALPLEKRLTFEEKVKAVLAVLESMKFSDGSQVNLLIEDSLIREGEAVLNAPLGMDITPAKWHEKYMDPEWLGAWVKAIGEYYDAEVELMHLEGEGANVGNPIIGSFKLKAMTEPI